MIKPALFIFVSFLFFQTVSAQKTAASFYYLQNNGRVLSTIVGADFLLEILPPDTSVDKNLFVVKEYYPDGKIRYISNSKTRKLTVIDPKFPDFYKPVLQGACISFFPNGHKMKIENFEDGDQVGDETEYYPNGKIYCTKTRTLNEKLICDECRDSTGKVLVQNGNGKWLTFIDESFKNYVEGNVSNGLEEGEWYGKRNDTVDIVYLYKNGELKSCANIDKSGLKTYTKVEVYPEFAGGIDAFLKYIGHNIHYPAVARENNTQGRVIISFVVEKNGSITDVKVARGIGGGCDEEAARVITLSPKWKPGMQDGKPERVAYSVPISFTLAK